MDDSGANVLMAPPPPPPAAIELLASAAAPSGSLSAPPSTSSSSSQPQSLSTPTSPVKGSTLLQRQVSRALEMIELYDGATAAALLAAAGDAATTTTTTSSTTTTNTPSAAASAGATAPSAAVHVPCRSFKALAKKCPKAVFQISPNAVKRKRSHSMSSLSSAAATAASEHASVDSLRASLELAEKLGSPVAAAAHKRSNTGGATSAKKPRDVRVTPSKRCAGKPKDKKSRDKGDVVDAALRQFRAERGDAAAAAARCFEFASASARRGDADSAQVRVRVGVAAAQGARAYMEDRFSVVARLCDGLDDPRRSPSLLAVYDGHNGALAAEFAAARFRELLGGDAFLRDAAQRAALGDADVAHVQRLLADAFATVDDEVLELTMARNKRDGSTVLLGLLVCGKLFVANLGDSRGVWARAPGDVVRVSVDHKPDVADEARRVEEAGGKVIFSGCWRVAHDEIPLRLAISRSLGDHPLKTNLPLSCSAPLVSVAPDIHVLDVGGAGEFVVFASDGLWDRLSDDDAARLVRDALPPGGAPPSKEALRAAADALVETALERRSMDNITAMVIAWADDDDDAFRADEVADVESAESP